MSSLRKKSSVSSILVLAILALPSISHAMPNSKRTDLMLEARDMFFHAYNAYMENAFPADELMPLSCRGRYRGVEPNRGDIDDALGNFTLTLIDSLDTLVVLNDLEEFERGVGLVIKHVNFDHDISVSVFETNIRVVGGLLSAHVLAELIHSRGQGMAQYKGELLNMAMDVGYRMLPAFNSTTGLPHPRVNLRHGIKPGKVKQVGETCTACAGTMILEFAALSRLSGEPIFEEKAKKAMDVLWSSRHRQSNLVGNVLNVNTGDWIRRDSGVGAGIDSYYEYVAKAYVLLGDDKYLSRWNTHYAAIMKYLGQKHVMQDVMMHRPHTTSKHFIDSLGAFWPGLQVLMGDVKPAIESHEILYQILQRHDFIPEAFTSDFQVHWGQHLLRPEFVESTYFLYRATHDPHYLEVGERVLKSLQKHARVTCGYASIKDVRTMQKEDRMDSFVLAETFKYLYLLFAKESDLVLDINSFVFTTEGHLLPLSLARLSPSTSVPISSSQQKETIHDEDVEFALSCPSTHYLFPGNSNYVRDLRTPLANVVESKCPTKRNIKRKLFASDFQSGNAEHLALVKNMGITIINLPDGRVQLLHTIANAKSTEDGEEGLLFMQEMIDLSKQQTTMPETQAKVVSFMVDNSLKMIFAGPAQFGRELAEGFKVSGPLVVAEPMKACSTPSNSIEFWGKIVLVERGDCMFVEKARILEKAGARGGIVVDSNKGTSSSNSPLFSMSGDGTDDISIPMVFVFSNDAKDITEALASDPKLAVTLMDSAEAENNQAASSQEEAEEDYDMTSPVRSFLERSKKQVESYFRQKMGLSEGEEDSSDIGADDQEKEIIYVSGKEVPMGDESLHKQDPSAGDPNTCQSRSDSGLAAGKSPPGHSERLEDFLNPDNSAVRTLIEQKVLKKPNILSEMLSTKFSDLVRLFEDFLTTKGLSVEAAYLSLLEIVEKEGAEGVARRASELLVVTAMDTQEEEYDEIDNDGEADGLVKIIASDGDGAVDDYKYTTSDDLRSNVNSKYLGGVLSDEDIENILTSYLSGIAQNTESEVAEDRRAKVKAAAIIDLLADELNDRVAEQKFRRDFAHANGESEADDLDEDEDGMELLPAKSAKDEL